MIVRHFDIKTPQTLPPQNEGWQPTWHGYWEMTKCETPQRKSEYAAQDRATRDSGMMTEAEFERDCLLSILSDIKRPQVNMFELGAGWGRMSLALAGVIDFKLAPSIPSGYRCLAVEAEPSHYQWLKEHFEVQKINGVAVYGAVSNKSGTSRFGIDDAPDAQYGQVMTSLTSDRHLPSIGNLIYVLTRKTVKVPVYTVDQLIKTHGFDRVDILDIDVQGAEYKVMRGAAESIKKSLIDYIMIGTHDKKYNEQLRRLLSPRFDLILDIFPDSIARVNGFDPIKLHDGVQLFRRQGL